MCAKENGLRKKMLGRTSYFFCLVHDTPKYQTNSQKGAIHALT